MKTKRLISYVILSVGSLVILLPFFWGVSSSLRFFEDNFTVPLQWLPSRLALENYQKIWTLIPLHLFLLNSAKITLLSIAGQIVSCSLVAFAFAKLRFPGKNILFLLVLATLMIPYQVTMIPVFMIMRSLGWINTHLPLIVPYWFAPAFGIFLFRQFFLTLPSALYDAAKIDGCNPFRIYWLIYMPLSKAPIAVVTIFGFIQVWNNLIAPLIYLQSENKMTVTVGLAMLKGQFTSNFSLLMAVSLVSMIPTIIVFIAAQKYFIRGIALTGIKGA